MNLFYGIVQVFTLKLLLFQIISSEIISFRDGEITYEYNNETGFLGGGSGGNVFKGIRTVGNETEAVACKEEHLVFKHLDNEADIYEKIGPHDSIPKIFHYSKSSNNETKSILVMELLGDSLEKLFNKFKPFSTATVMRIGLQLLDVFDYIYSKGVTYNDLKPDNLAVGSKNNSRIYLIDFGICKRSTLINGEPDVGRMDLRLLAHLLIRFKQGKSAWETDDIDDVDCKDTLQFLLEVKISPEKNPDSAEIKNILRTELEKHRNESNYYNFEWQTPQNDKEVEP